MRATTLTQPMRKSQTRTHTTQTLPAPMGGFDSISPVALMPPTNALEIDNFIATDSGLSIREGWYEYAYNIDAGGAVHTILSYDAKPPNGTANPLASSELFACTNNGIFLIEGGGDFTGQTPAIALSGALGAGRFSSVQFSTGGASYLVACSEIDGAFLYDGTTWTKMVASGTAGPGVITGADPATFVQVMAWKKRLMFVQGATSKMWVLPVDSVGGTVELFDFGALLSHGGVVTALISWTMDAGAGIDDRLVVLGNAGDLLVYEGTDPTNAAAFRCVGSWYLGQMPIGRRNFTSSGGNIYILCQYGLMPVSQIVEGGLDNVLTSQTQMLKQMRLLQQQLARDFLTKINTVGWEVLDLPAKQLMVILRPRVSVTDNTLYAFQMQTMAWSLLRDLPITTVRQRLSEIYGGTEDGRVIRLFDGYSDAKRYDGTNAQHIRAKVTPAFNYLGSPDVLKQALMVRPTFISGETLSYVIKMNTDFDIPVEFVTPIELSSIGCLWDSAYWDNDYWTPATSSSYEWRTVEGLGFSMTPTIYVSARSRTVLAAIEYMFRPGGPL